MTTTMQQRLIQALDASGLTDSAVARLAGVQPHQICNWRAGKHSITERNFLRVIQAIDRAKRCG